MAQVSDILDRYWTRIVGFDHETVFPAGPAQETAPGIVVEDAGWTLFAFDFNRRQAVFLDVGVDCDLSQAPFAYAMQAEKARRKLLMTFDEFLELDARLADVKGLVQFFNMGHCGSTLLHKVFNRVPSVWCVSEPVAFINLAMVRQSEDAALLQNLARVSLKLLPRFPGAAYAQCLVVKHFSQSTTQFELLHAAQPQGKCLFMYRDALGWSNSLYHFVQKLGATMQVARDKRSFYWNIMSGAEPESYLDGVIDLHAEQLTFDSLTAAAWALHMQQFQTASRSGVPLFTLRYNELAEHREESLTRVFAHLGLPETAVGNTLSAFDTHAHEGTRTARSADDLDFDETNYARVRKILEHPRFAMDSNVILDEGV